MANNRSGPPIIINNIRPFTSIKANNSATINTNKVGEASLHPLLLAFILGLLVALVLVSASQILVGRLVLTQVLVALALQALVFGLA